ncbi:Uncharacterized protein Adt_33091 [Abeliophyllum distichum]|uniref:Uncharacterized protein n=1 Tax=Abeliophyllum distichum TaxID=126358 RepID=A0ABD1QV89_9LAMI
MTREDCKSAFWKERFIAGLPKLFAEKGSSAIKDEFPNLPYDSHLCESSSSSKSSNSIKICNCKDNCTCETNSVNVLTSERELIQDIISQIQDPDLKQKFQQILDPVQEQKPPPRNYNINDVFDRFKKPNKSSSSQDLRHEVNNMKQQISELDKELSKLKFEVSIIKTYSPSPSKGKEKIQSHSNSETSDSSNDENIASLDSPIKISSPSNEKQSMNIISQIRLQKWYTMATIIINKEFRIKTRVLLILEQTKTVFVKGLFPQDILKKLLETLR